MATPKGSKVWNSGTSKGWVDPRGYRQIRVNGKTVREHRVVMEKYLGRKLEPWEHVHHKDGDKTNNSLANLEVIDGASHAIEHHKNSKRSDQAKITMATMANMRQEILRRKAINSELLEALKDIFKMIEEGLLVRDISRDHDPMWACLAIGFVTRLKFAQDAIAKAEGGS